MNESAEPRAVFAGMAHITLNHRLAVAIFALFTVGYFGADMLLRAVGWTGPGAALLWLLFWALAFIVTVVVALDALFRGSGTAGSAWGAIIDRGAPLAALLAASAVLYFASTLLARHNQREFARAHSAELAGPPPQAVIYSEGIPDGGTVIVRLPGRNPETLPQATMVDLSGERLKRCSPLDDRDWFCSFD